MSADSSERGKRQKGFTIVETLIFLAISGLMFAAAVMDLNSQQKSTAFQTGVGVLVSQLDNDLQNSINGNFQFPSGLQCTTTSLGSTVPNITTTTTPGSTAVPDPNCVFLGDVIGFGFKNSNNQPAYWNIAVLGNQYTNGSSDSSLASNYFSQSNPTAFYYSGHSASSPYTQYDTVSDSVSAIPNSMNVRWVQACNPTCSSIAYSRQYAAFALFNYSRAASQPSGGASTVNSGSLPFALLPIPNYSFPFSASSEPTTPSTLIISGINSIKNCKLIGSTYCGAQIDPPGGIEVCLTKGSQSVILTIGGINSYDSVSKKVFNNGTCS